MRLAFVTPWYGIDAPGGAEALARRTSEQLYQRGISVEVLTTCARDVYSDWGRDHYPAGPDRVNGVPVRRFPVRHNRDRDAFDAINVRLMAGVPVSRAEEEIFIREMINSDALMEYIGHHMQDTLFFFVSYMFGTTYWGIKLCPQRAWLIPCLHDETYARMSIFWQMFTQARGVLFLSRPEAALARRLYSMDHVRSLVIGAGVDTDYAGDAQAFRQKYGIEGPFALYAGRKDPGKNVPMLLDYHQRYCQRRGPGLKLALTGGGAFPAGSRGVPNVVDLGRLPTHDLFDAYAAASFLCQPSSHESFSLVLMEAWIAGTPGLVYEGCEVTTDFVRKANGGLYFTGYDEYEACTDLLLSRPYLRQQLGRQGREYVLRNFAWDTIAQRYEAILRNELPEGAS